MRKLLFLSSPETFVSSRSGEVFLLRELLESYKLEVLVDEEYQNLYNLLEKSFFRKKKNFSLFKVKKLPFLFPKGERKKYLETMKNLMDSIVVPGSNLAIWKITLLDDFASNLAKYYYQLPDFKEVSAVLLPLYDTTETSFFTGYYSFQLFKLCREKGIPVVGIETEKISLSYYYQYNFYDYYLISSTESREILVKKLKVPEERVFVLKDRYRNVLATKSELPVNVINLCGEVSPIFKYITRGIPVVTAVHDPIERYTFRKLLRFLRRVKRKFLLVVVTDPTKFVISMREREIALEAYKDEYAKLKKNTYDILILDTNYRTPALISMFSDVAIYTNPETFRNFSCRYDNVFLFPPDELRNKEAENKLLGAVNSVVSSPKRSLSEAISEVLGRYQCT